MTESILGIDLGTTHCTIASVDASADERTAHPAVQPVPQLVSPNEVDKRELLPSFLYFRHSSEAELTTPWHGDPDFAVGEYARRRSSEAPARVVSSAKSWLCHPTVDRRAPLLPLGAPDDVEKISPVEASFRYLDHLAEALRAGDAPTELSEQEVVLTVPASFDAAARDLTAEAATVTGIENLTLLEEPQAALYAWIAASGDAWREHLQVGDVVLVVDVGGGTTDFSAIAAVENEGALELRRLAVGDHILLGGDNMDLALAHVAARKLAQANDKPLDAWQMSALTHSARGAKERLLNSEGAGQAPESVPVVVPSRGSALLGGSLRTELTHDDVYATLVEGFFPLVSADDAPRARARAGLSQLGLPYAADAAVTKHLAAFLRRQASATEGLPGFTASTDLLRPTAVLFNGGVFKANALRKRLLETLNSWLQSVGAAPARDLPGSDLDLAVARGAAYYGLVRRGKGLRIRGGTERAYYVGIESPTPAVPGMEPPTIALCVAPFGMEEGTHADLPPQELYVVVGEPVEFRLFGSTVRRNDRSGFELERWKAGELEELSPIEITLPAEGREPGTVVAVRIEGSVTALGTLLLEAIPLQPLKPNERWKVELSVRQTSPNAS